MKGEYLTILLTILMSMAASKTMSQYIVEDVDTIYYNCISESEVEITGTSLTVI